MHKFVITRVNFRIFSKLFWPHAYGTKIKTMMKDLIDRSRVELRDWEDAQGCEGQDSKHAKLKVDLLKWLLKVTDSMANRKLKNSRLQLKNNNSCSKSSDKKTTSANEQINNFRSTSFYLLSPQKCPLLEGANWNIFGIHAVVFFLFQSWWVTCQNISSIFIRYLD